MIHRLAIRHAAELSADLSFESTTDREAALQDADFVITRSTSKATTTLGRLGRWTAKHGYH